MTQASIRRLLRALRLECIDEETDPRVKDVAYVMECAIRRVTEPGIRDWGTLTEMARKFARKESSS